jgi:hypothetical protein
MEKKSEYLDFVKYRKGRTEMSDVLLARELVNDIGGSGRVNEIIYRALKALQKMFPHDDEPHKRWTERRLKSWWNRESENVMHWQMVELYQVAAKEKEERALLDAARREHAKFIEKTARLRAVLERQDEDFHSPQIEGLGSIMGRVDRPRNQGD